MEDDITSTIQLQFIKGLMFGMEYAETPEGMFMVVLDLGVIRFLYYKGPSSLFDFEEDDGY